jgi:hypothetical protein
MRNGSMAKTDLTAQRLRELLHYDPETGVFTWKVANGTRAKVGAIAGSLSKGYILVRVDALNRRAHRLAWFYVNGEWPTDEIDHINGDKSDNRICNLRCVSRSVNLQNQRQPRSDNARGLYLGVGWDKARQKWRAQIKDGKNTFLGRFNSQEEASEAYLAAKRRLHPGGMI